MNLTDTLYFHNIRGNQRGLDACSLLPFWENMRAECGPGGNFYLDINHRFRESRFVTRNGEWSLPWPQEIIPGFEMPEYNPTFSKTFDQVSNERALEIKQKINDGQKFAVMYSGGIDSTVILVALIQNLTKEELESVAICTSVHSMMENPEIWANHIHGKFKIIDSTYNRYDDFINLGYRPITGDEGDCIFGTSFALQLYHNYDYYVYASTNSSEIRQNLFKIKQDISNPEVHFSQYKAIIIRYLAYNTTPEGLEFGRLLYEKYVHGVNTGTVPVNSLHDFFWWLIFNIKYLNCAVRGSIFFNRHITVKDGIDSIENWFSGKDYQRWSMVNNNNGCKIRNTLATYKFAARDYIYKFDNNPWYSEFKSKLESLGNLNLSNKYTDNNPAQRIVAVDKNYNRIAMEDAGVKEYFLHHLSNYKIDWTDY
jgi:hypothetical protein